MKSPSWLSGSSGAPENPMNAKPSMSQAQAKIMSTATPTASGNNNNPMMAKPSVMQTMASQSNQVNQPEVLNRPASTVYQPVTQEAQQPPPPPAPKGPKLKWLVKSSFFVINLFFSTLTAITGILAIASFRNINDTAIIFVGLYMILFSAILYAYECVQICPCAFVDNLIKRNTGFLYGIYGKSAYTIFMGFLSFGATSKYQDHRVYSLAIANGILVGLWGAIQAMVYTAIPDHFDKKEKYTP